MAVEQAKAFVEKGGKRGVAVIVNRVKTAWEIAGTLGGTGEVLLLTGRLCPYERDLLVERWSSS